MLRKVIEKSALEESRASVMGALALVERRLTSDASLADSSDFASGVGGGTRVSQPRHRRQRSFADAVAETVDVSKLLIPEGSQDIIWRMLFGSKERSPRGKGGRVERAGWGFRAFAHRRGGRGARLGRRLRRRREKIEETTRRRALLERAFRGRRGGHHARLPRSGTRRDICRAPREASTRGVRLSAVQENLSRGVRRAWLAARLVDGDGTEAAFASRRLFASAAESLFSSRDSAVADVARWKRRAASLELELQALERRAAFVAGEAAHARAALADAMDRTAPEPRSAARGGFFSS